MSNEIVLPESINPATWNPDTAAMMEFAGLTWFEGTGDNRIRVFAPSGIMAGFIAACKRTGLDPTAKQIYAMEIGGKWTVVTGVDGMRVVAQRSREYQGQTPIQWTADGVTWVDAWLPELQGGKKNDKPAAARVGILRRGFTEPLYQVVTWDEFGKTTGQWPKIPAHMLGIRAETHGLRRAFPNDLSGLYTVEDFDTDAVDTSDAFVIEPTEDWAGLIDAAESKAELTAIRARGMEAGEWNDRLRALALAKAGMFNRGEIAEAQTESSLDPADPNYVEPVNA